MRTCVRTGGFVANFRSICGFLATNRRDVHGLRAAGAAQARRRSVAHRVSWWRVESWSFRSTEETWLSTVLTEM